MALEDNLLAGCDAAGLGLCVADCSFHRTCPSRVAVQSARSRINYLVNLTLFAGVSAAIFSGVLISQKAIPALTGANAAPNMDWRWDTLHNQFSADLLILSGFHLAINWDWVLAAGERLLSRLRRFREDTL